MGTFSVLPYLSIICTTALLGWTLVTIPPSSPKRHLMLPLILSSAAVTSITATYASHVASWNVFLAMEYGTLMILEIIDKVCLSSLYYPEDSPRATPVPKDGKAKRPAESSWTKFLNAVRWSVDLAINKRRVRHPSQVKNVPPFDANRPEHIPSRSSFLLSRAVRFSLLYLLIDFVVSQPVLDAESKFAPGKDRILARILAHQFSLPEAGETVGVVIAYWGLSYLSMTMSYDFFSLIGVGSGMNQVADWPPLMGSIKEPYSMRQFWG